jgi:hypothetical protein
VAKLFVLNLEKRQLLSPIPDEITYGLYGNLCKPVHGAVYSTDIHQGFREGTRAFAVDFIGSAFEKYLGNLDRTIDTGIVLTFNLLR